MRDWDGPDFVGACGAGLFNHRTRAGDVVVAERHSSSSWRGCSSRGWAGGEAAQTDGWGCLGFLAGRSTLKGESRAGRLSGRDGNAPRKASGEKAQLGVGQRAVGDAEASSAADARRRPAGRSRQGSYCRAPANVKAK